MRRRRGVSVGLAGWMRPGGRMGARLGVFGALILAVLLGKGADAVSDAAAARARPWARIGARPRVLALLDLRGHRAAPVHRIGVAGGHRLDADPGGGESDY